MGARGRAADHSPQSTRPRVCRATATGVHDEAPIAGPGHALAVTALMAFTGLASADAVITDGDAAAGQQPNVHIGTVAPGAEVTVPVAFDLRCSTSNHVDLGQTVTLSLFQAMAAPGGAVVSVPPARRPDPGRLAGRRRDLSRPAAASGQHDLRHGHAARAAAAQRRLHLHDQVQPRSYSPTGNVDGSALGVTPSVVIRLDVVDNTAPACPARRPDGRGRHDRRLDRRLPRVSATDAEDDPDPTPTCSPAARRRAAAWARPRSPARSPTAAA